MSVLLAVSDVLEQWLVPFLEAAGLVLCSLLTVLLAQRVLDTRRRRWRARLESRYRLLVDRAIASDARADEPARLAHQVPAAHLPVVADVLLATIRWLYGSPVDRGREVARALHLLEQWRRDLRDGHWWVRAEAARALGAVCDVESFDAVAAVIDDEHEEVRAASIWALGRFGDLRAMPLLLDRLSADGRHQTVRVMEALQAIGAPGGDHLLTYLRTSPAMLPPTADLLATAAGSAALDDLLEWSGHPSAAVRSAAWRAIGTIGLCARGYYYALRALSDDEPSVRATAARAIGRNGRTDAVAHLTRGADDVWEVSAQCAKALAALGAAGEAELQRWIAAGGAAGELARQVLWQSQAAADVVQQPS